MKSPSSKLWRGRWFFAVIEDDVPDEVVEVGVARLEQVPVMCQDSKRRRPITEWRQMPSTIRRSKFSITASPVFSPKRITSPPRRTQAMALLTLEFCPVISSATSTPDAVGELADCVGELGVVATGELAGAMLLGREDHVGPERLGHRARGSRRGSTPMM